MGSIAHPTMAAVQVNHLPSSSLPVEHKPLVVLPLEDVARVLEAGLKKNFSDASVTVVDCPDLMPSVKREKLYDMKDYPELTGMKSGLVIGAGAAPWPFLNRNAEMMPNLMVKEDKSVIQETHIARTFDEDGSYTTMKLPATETRNSVLGNLFISEGTSGKVLKIHCKKRTGDKNFVTCMRQTLVDEFPDKSIGLGGVFNIVSGKVKIHVMPDFSPCPIDTDEEVNKWLKFYKMSAPFTVLSVFVANDPGLDLRVEHSHGWGKDGQGGHYHYDTTPEEVEYLGYYNLGELCYRVDRPVETHMVGRD